MLAKRCFDVVVAGSMLLFLGPVLAVCAALSRWKLGPGILFAQARPGLNGEIFTLYKFRTMTNATDAGGQLLSDSERLTRYGKFLRSSSLDELPELYNVLKGEMSLIGPRPLLPEYLPLYSARQARRHEVLPGITGWAQVNGRNAVSWDDRIEMDVWYVDNRSFMLDLKILCRTVGTVLRRADVSEKGGVTMSRFTGSEKPK